MVMSKSAADGGTGCPGREFIGNSAVFLREVGKLPTIAGCDAGVLILGETGTGKEVFAQSIHYLSARAGRAWVAVNCGAIPTDLVENELFGHAKGAYTTAHSAQTGLVREAEGGTLFLDDVDCLPLAAQAKLLRFLQEREYRAVGSHVTQHADVRVIAASNRSLPDLAAAGAFRADLYFRLNVLTLRLPALRDRREDIGMLARHFILQFARRYRRATDRLSPAALRKLELHDWPGNVRELEHVIERAVVLGAAPELPADDIDIDTAELADPARHGARDEDSFGAAKARVVEQFERSYVERLLSDNDGNVTHAARAAKKNRRAFFALMQKHGISPERYRSAS
jgi:two-component system response regulator GlrR